MYLIPSTTTFPHYHITLGGFISKSILVKERNREKIEKKNTTRNNIATLNHLGIYELSLYKTAEKQIKK